MASHSSFLPGPELEEGLTHLDFEVECAVQEQVEEDDQIDPLDFLRQLQVPSPPKDTVSSTGHGDDGQGHQTHVASSNPSLLFEAAPSSTQGTSQCGRANTPLEMPIACTECRLMKTKCDRVWPTCRRCARKGCVCVYPDPAKMGRPPKRKLDEMELSETSGDTSFGSSSESVDWRVTIHPNQSELQSLSDSLFRAEPPVGVPTASPPNSPPLHDEHTKQRTSNFEFVLSVMIGIFSIIFQVYGFSYGFLKTEFNSLVNHYYLLEFKILSYHLCLLSMPLPFILFSCVVCPEKDDEVFHDKKYLSCVIVGLVVTCARTRAAWIIHAFPDETYGVPIDDDSRIVNSCHAALVTWVALSRKALHILKPSWFWKANMYTHAACAIILGSFNIQFWRMSSDVFGQCPAYFRTSNKTLNSLGAISVVVGQCLPLLFRKRSTRLWVRSFFV